MTSIQIQDSLKVCEAIRGDTTPDFDDVRALAAVMVQILCHLEPEPSATAAKVRFPTNG